MTQIHYLTAFRERTGMTQSALAALLQVNRSAINMYERNERMLPAEPTLRLMKLMQLMNDAALSSAAAPQAPTAEQQEKRKQKLLQHASQKRREAANLEIKIAALEKAEAQRGNMRLLLAAMKQLHANTATTKHEAKWLALRESLSGHLYDYQDWEREQHDLHRLRHTTLLNETEEAERMAGEV